MRWPTAAVVAGQVVNEMGEGVPAASIAMHLILIGFPPDVVDSGCSGRPSAADRPRVERSDSTGRFRVELVFGAPQVNACVHVRVTPPPGLSLLPKEVTTRALHFRPAYPHTQLDSVFIALTISGAP
jgi:hypothetical protein